MNSKVHDRNFRGRCWWVNCLLCCHHHQNLSGYKVLLWLILNIILQFNSIGPSLKLRAARGPLKNMFPVKFVWAVTAWNQSDDCFCQRPISLTMLLAITVPRGCSPPRPSGPTLYGRITELFAFRFREVSPHDAMAESPINSNSFPTILCPRPNLHSRTKTKLKNTHKTWVRQLDWPTRQWKQHCHQDEWRGIAQYLCSLTQPS